MNEKNQIFSARFKSARLLNGWSLQDLADKLGNKVSRQALHKYEKGDVIPDSEMIGLLSEVLDVRPDFFFHEQSVELEEINFRKLSKLPSKEEKRVIELTRDILSRYIELEEIIGIQTPFKSPLENITPVKEFKDVEQAALKVRKEWKLGIDPIFNALELLEDYNIKVIDIEVMDGFDGLQSKIKGTIPVIVYNKSRLKKPDRIRFTVMHELGHLLLPMDTSLSEKSRETLCNQFAASMLFPEEAVLKEIGKSRHRLFIQELGFLKQQYGISIQAILMRLKDLGIITDSYCKQFFFYINQRGWKIEEPVEYEGIEKSGRFDQLLYRALAEELISISKAASLKNMKVAEFKSQGMMM